MPAVLGPDAPPERSSVALVASVAAHALLMLALFAGSRRLEPMRRQAPATPRVELISLPPLPTPSPAEVPVVRNPRPRQVPRPQVTRGPDLPDEVFFRQETPPPDLIVAMPPAATAPEPPSEQPRRELASAERAAPSMESEAQRLFGPKRSGAGGELRPVPARSWINALTEDRENDCIPRAPVARATGTPVELGVISGVVYREGTREPLGGAFLQILGTPYSAFADARGAYALSFDRALVDDCRTQYVQVSKDGFAPRRLILSLGHRVSNDIPLSRR